jgi:5-methylcytosine-specific restriction endonuclease McrA
MLKRNKRPNPIRRTLRRGELTRDEKAVIRRRVFERDNYCCVDCGTPIVWESGLWTSGHLCHLRSRGAGGSLTDEANLATKCLGCHIGRDHNAGGKPCPSK